MCTAEQFGGDTLGPLGGGGGFRPTSAAAGAGNFLQIDEATLRSIARTTGGTYPRAASAGSSSGCSRSAPAHRHGEGGARAHRVPRGLGALLAVGAVATSRWWNRFS